jgi:hypothetical protein
MMQCRLPGYHHEHGARRRPVCRASKQYGIIQKEAGHTMNRKANERRDREAELVELDPDSEQADSESGGQSGDMQGLATDGEAADQSVEELAEEGQPYEASVVDGVEDAGAHPEHPVRSHEDQRPAHESELPPDPDWK